MRKIVYLIAFIFSVISVQAQTALPVAATGNVLVNGTGASNASIASTATNGFKLAVNGAAIIWGTGTNTVTSPSLYLRNTTASTGKIWAFNSDNSGIFAIADASGTTSPLTHVNRFVISALGNVGIGTAAPNNKLEIDNTTAGTSGLRFTRLTSASTAAASNGKVLSVDGNGTVFLATDSTVSNLGWLLNGSTVPALKTLGTINSFDLPFITANIERMRISSAGNVGIGITAPLAQFHTTGTLRFDKFKNNAAGDSVLTTDVSGNVVFRKIAAAVIDSSKWTLSGANIFNKNAGNTGIGTATPGSKLEINNTTAGTSGLRFTQLTSAATASASNGKVLTVDGSGNVILAKDSLGAAGNGWNQNGNTVGAVKTIGTIDNFDLPVITGNTEKMRVTSAGNIGIGVTAPLAQLHTTSTVRFDKFKNNAAGDSVLTTDINGNVLLKKIASSAAMDSSKWTISGVNIFNKNSGNVGVGITTPGYKLDVNGTFHISGASYLQGTLNYVNQGFSDINNAQAQLNFPGDGSIGISTGTTVSARAFTATANGNIGIGTTTPTYLLDVNGTGRVQGNFTVGPATLITAGANLIMSYTAPVAATGDGNVGLGLHGNFQTLTTGRQNVGIGDYSTASITTGLSNTAAGPGSNQRVTTGSYNTAIGFQALQWVSASNKNIGIGNLSNRADMGIHNIAIGNNNITAFSKTASWGNNNIFIGSFANDADSTLNNNIVLGDSSRTLGTSNTTIVGSNISTNVSNVLMLGSTSQNIIIGGANNQFDNGNRLQVNGNIWSTGFVLPPGAAAGKVLTSDANGVASWQPATGGSGSSSWFTTGNNIYNANAGLVIIGSLSNPMPSDTSLKLAVKGNIYAKKLKVTQSGWADYVFASTYKLRPLKEVENFIQANRHLPEMPSAAEVDKNGIDVGDNQVLLLKKVEELTLYAIEQNKKQEAQQKIIDNQMKLLLQLKAEIERLQSKKDKK